MYKRSEGFFKSHHDTNLFFQIWENPDAQATIIINHGQGEHSESYSRFISAFENDRWSFYSWDLRGHGRSDGRRGYVADFDEYCKDYKIFLDMVLKQEKVRKGPVVLFCHSMGALIQLKTLIQNRDIKFDALVVSAPLLGLSVPVPIFKSKGATILNKILPQFTLGNEINNEMLTRDPDVIREFEQDALRHTKISSGAFLGILESIDYVVPRANEITKPALFIVAEHDPVISTPATKDFYNKLGSTNKEIYVYPDAKHELLNDINRQTVYSDVKNFLDRILEKSI